MADETSDKNQNESTPPVEVKKVTASLPKKSKISKSGCSREKASRIEQRKISLSKSIGRSEANGRIFDLI